MLKFYDSRYLIKPSGKTYTSTFRLFFFFLFLFMYIANLESAGTNNRNLNKILSKLIKINSPEQDQLNKVSLGARNLLDNF